MDNNSKTRKRQHLEICASGEAGFKKKTTLLEEIELVPRALPEIDLADVDTTTTFAGRDLSAPLWIGAMTGGTGDGSDFNRDMATVAGELGIGFCLGSLRPMIDDPSLAGEFQVRKVAPDVLLVGNVGGTEIVRRGTGPILDALTRVEADGVNVHLNPMMELVQPGGDTNFAGVIDGISELNDARGDLFVAVKETGCGLSYEDGLLLKRRGIEIVEVAGAGGTSWTGVETMRASGRQKRLGQTLWDWGIPTAVSTAWMVDAGLTVVASGGVYTGGDMAKCLAIGASLTGVAGPLVGAWKEGGAAGARDLLEDMIQGLRYTMLGCGVSKISDLRRSARVMGPSLSRWMETGWKAR